MLDEEIYYDKILLIKFLIFLLNIYKYKYNCKSFNFIEKQ